MPGTTVNRHQQRLPQRGGEQGGGRGTDVEPPDRLCGGHPGGRTGAAAALCGHPAGHRRRVGGGLRRAAAGAQGRGDVAALRRPPLREPTPRKDYWLTFKVVGKLVSTINLFWLGGLYVVRHASSFFLCPKKQASDVAVIGAATVRCDKGLSLVIISMPI